MRARNQHLLGLTFLLVLSLFAYQRPRASDFVFGGFTDYTPMEILNKDWYDSAGLNAIAIAVDTPGTPGTGLDSLAARNWKVMATIERQSDTAHNRSWPLYAGLHSHLIHWQAEDTGSVPLYNGGVTTCVCGQGELSGQYWHIVPGTHPVTPGVADWQLREHYQQTDLDYTAIFYMKIDSIGNPGDTVARISVVDTVPETHSRILVDSMYVRAGDFQGNGVLSPFFITYRFGTPPGPWNSNIAVDWWGTRELWMDSVIIYNPEGRQLVRDEPSLLRDSVRAQAARYDSTFLPDTNLPALQWWHGEENYYSFDGKQHGYPYVDFLEVAAYLDSLLSDDYSQGFMCDRNLTEPFAYVGFDSIYLSRAWPQHRNYMMWCYSFTHEDPEQVLVPEPDSLNLLEVQARFDTVTQALEYSRSLTERFNADLHYVAQAWGQTAAGLGDSLRPTQSELKCLSFLGLAFAVDGLWYWPYDSGGDLYRGLLLGGDGGPWRKSLKYYTVQNYISPIVSRFAETLQGLQRRGTGRLDTLLSANWNPVSGVLSQPMTDPYVEAAVFEDASSLANYLVLVNRNTSTTSSRQLTLTIDPARLLASGRTHYYVIDLNPSYSGQEQDTLLAGPIAGEIRYSTVIDPGGIKLLKIAQAPDRIAGTNFPAKWWGAIHAGGALTLAAGRTLHLESPLTFSMHLDSGSFLKFTVQGQLTAVGSQSSPILFTRVKSGVNGIWGGLDFSGLAPACTLQYCNIEYSAPAIATGADLLIDHVTVSHGGDTACLIQPFPSAKVVTITNSTFDGTVRATRGTTHITGCLIDSATTGIDASGSGQPGDSLIVEHTRITNSSGPAIQANAFPLRAVRCSLTVASIGVSARNASARLDSLYVASCAQGIRIDSNTVLSGKGDKLEQSGGVGFTFYKGWGSLDSSWVISADTAVWADPGTGHTVVLTRFNAAGQNSKKGIAARSGQVELHGSYIYATALTGVEAFTGSALVRLDSTEVQASPSSSAAISVGPNARLVARDCSIHDSWMGFEIQGNDCDSVISCRVTNNVVYGIWFNHGTSVGSSADYSANNVISNTAANDVNVGLHILQQSITSVNDSVKGGYNWDYNLNTYSTSGKAARVIQASIIGKLGDDWGLVLNGLSASNDSAFVTSTSADSSFSQANVYVRQIYAQITDGHFVSKAGFAGAPYGILERDGTSGYVGCTWAKNQRTACVKREGSTSGLVWTAYLNSSAGNNTFYSGTSGAYYFANYGSDTVDVRHNYWGSTSSPVSHLYGKVKYSPYYTYDNCANQTAKVSALEVGELPEDFALEQNYPNPFNPATTIQFSLPVEQMVQLDLFNVLGQRVRSFDLGSLPAGVHSVIWNGTTGYGTPVGSGLYFYRLTTPEYNSTKKMLFLK